MIRTNTTPDMRGNADVSAFVLAGGGSTRMGTDKALLRFQNVALVERALYRLRSIGLHPGIVGSRADLRNCAPIIPDLHEHCGPLSGLEAGLSASSAPLTLFIPVDLPLLPAALLSRLITRALITNAPATIPCILGQPQPLAAVYHRDLLPVVSRALAMGDYKVMRVIQQGAAALGQPIDMFNVETVIGASGNYAGWPRVPANAFLNCNTPDDLKRAALCAGHLNIDNSFQ